MVETAQPGFAALREAHLSELDRGALERWYGAVAGYLVDADKQTRASAVERLGMAVFWAERAAARTAPAEGRQGWSIDTQARLRWLLALLEEAHQRFDDVIPAFVKALRHHGQGNLQLLAWLRMLKAAPPPKVDATVVEGVILLVEPVDDESEADKARLVGLLDHDSNFVRACAALRLSSFSGSEAALFSLITEKELVRPGVAGPFWVGGSFDITDAPVEPIAWMMDLLERRQGPVPALGDGPDDMPSNDIEFHLHELCDRSPDMVRRMMEGGYLHLAVETATESRAPVAGMEPLLVELGDSAQKEVAVRAWRHLAMFYRCLHAKVVDGSIRRWPEWSPEAEAFSFHHGEAQRVWFLVCYPREARQFSAGEAARVIERALPASLRGSMVHDQLDIMRDSAPAPYDFGHSRRIQYESGASVALDGEPALEAWDRIEFSSGRLGERWRPLG